MPEDDQKLTAIKFIPSYDVLLEQSFEQIADRLNKKQPLSREETTILTMYVNLHGLVDAWKALTNAGAEMDMPQDVLINDPVKFQVLVTRSKQRLAEALQKLPLSDITDTPPALRGKSQKGVQPPAMSLMFNACLTDDDAAFLPFVEGERGGLRYERGENYLQLFHPDKAPEEMRDRDTAREVIEAWARSGVHGDLVRLDEMAWDVAALAVTAFYARTSGTDVDTRFVLLVDDYFDWRGVDPRNRSEEMRREVDERIQLLFKVDLYTKIQLRLPDPDTGKRKKTPVISAGPYLLGASRFYRQTRLALDELPVRPDGYRVGLGEWARVFVTERAMLGVYLRRLAQYDLRRCQWERRIGWYLLFQMQAQASKSTFVDTNKGQIQVTPQQPLKMRTILDNSHVPWEEMAATNPGKVIQQWLSALAKLQDDGILGDFHCLDGKLDGSDLPVRGRLSEMLERRHYIIPGPELVEHLRAKSNRVQQIKRIGLRNLNKKI